MLEDLLEGIRGIGEAFMEEDAIDVYRYSDDVNTWEEDLADQYDYGDDDIDHVEPETQAEAFVASFDAWIVSKIDRRVDVGDGRIELVQDQIIRVPVGSDIRRRDIVILPNNERMVVFDTNAADTHPEWMRLTLRGTE